MVDDEAVVDSRAFVQRSELHDVDVHGVVNIVESIIADEVRIGYAEDTGDDPARVVIDSSVIKEGTTVATYPKQPLVTQVLHSTIGIENEVETGAELSHVETGIGVTVEASIIHEAKIGSNSYIEGGAQIGRAGHPRVTIGSNVTVRHDAVIGAGAVIGDGAEIGQAAVVEPGGRVDDSMTIGPGDRVRGTYDPEKGEYRKPKPIGHAPGVSPDAWVYDRLADIAGEGRIDKRAIRRQRPELVDHRLVKHVLRMKPPPTGEQLREMADQNEIAHKYRVRLHHAGWDGGQQLVDQPNDVLLLDLTDEAIEEFIQHEPDDVPLRAGFIKVVLWMGKTNWHPGGKKWSNVGWLRFVRYEEHHSWLVEEIQSDLTIVTSTETRLASKMRSSKHIAYEGRPSEMGWAVRHAANDAAQARGINEYFDGPIDDEDLLYIGRQLHDYLSDFYPSALAFTMQYAREQRAEWVYIPDYRTKYAIVAETGMEPPRSVYEQLPKRFQPSVVVEVPRWMKIVPLGDEYAVRDEDPEVEAPSLTPKFRKLRTNPE